MLFVFREQSREVFRIPIAYFSIFKLSKKLEQKNLTSYQRMEAGQSLVHHMTVFGLTREACQLSQKLVALELEQKDRPIRDDNIASLYGVYTVCDPDKKLSKSEWLTLCKPAENQAFAMFERYKISAPDSSFRKSFSGPNIGIDRIFACLATAHRHHGCFEQAVICQKAAIEVAREVLGGDSIAYHACLYDLANYYHSHKKDAEARKLLNKCIALKSSLKTRSGNVLNDFTTTHIEECRALLEQLSE